MTGWVDIAALDDIPQRGGRVVKTHAGCIAVFRTIDDQVFALDDACPHKKGPLSEGIVHGTAVTCPLHNWVIDLATGSAKGADEGQVKTYQIRVEKGRLLLDPTRLTMTSAA
ncbi:MAG TPA: nitrite reductase small subunit NirD [Rhizobiales bacterium]|nr:nitrite reductase small subunit NirD [Hyphomicrobiales bacterium]